MNDTLIAEQAEDLCTNPCCAAGRPHLNVPSMMRSPSGIPQRFRNADFKGFYVSPCGNLFCCRPCWASYCED